MEDRLNVLDKKANPNENKDNIADKEVFILPKMASIIKHCNVEIYFVVEDFFVVWIFRITPKKIKIPDMLMIFFLHCESVVSSVVPFWVYLKHLFV